MFSCCRRFAFHSNLLLDTMETKRRLPMTVADWKPFVERPVTVIVFAGEDIMLLSLGNNISGKGVDCRESY